jgi:hypothetical protein
VGCKPRQSRYAPSFLQPTPGSMDCLAKIPKHMLQGSQERPWLKFSLPVKLIKKIDKFITIELEF